MLKQIMDLVMANADIIAYFTLGMCAMALLWLRKHPEDFYHIEEVEADDEEHV